MSGGDPGTCYSGNIDYYGSIRLLNYTGRNVNVTFVNFATDPDGSPTMTDSGNFIIDNSKPSSKSVSAPPSANSGTGGYTIIPGYTKSYNGMTIMSSDNSYAGMISTYGMTMDSGTCQDFWITIGLVSSTNAVTLVNSGGVAQVPKVHDNPLNDALYLVPYVGYWQNATYDPASYVYVSSQSISWLRVLVILLIFAIAIVVAVFLIKKYKTG
jgi:hypothetical protein